MSQIEYHLDQASGWWRWQLFIRRSTNLASALTIAVLLLGAAIWIGWIGSLAVATVALVLLTLCGLLAWVVLAMMSIDAHLNRTQSAQAVEQSHRPLLDRLNTLVFLEGKTDRSSIAMTRAIERQASQVLNDRPNDCPYSWRSVYGRLAVFVVCLIATILFYGQVRPWQYLTHNSAEGSELAEEASEELEIPELVDTLDESIAADVEQPWGELRISEPGRDLQVTRLDIVPLRIEAGSTKPLTEIKWSSTVNGGESVPHELTLPEDPRYAVFRPEILPEEFQLQEWDVLSYHAQATREDGNTYHSDIYFVQVLPFRDDLEKLAGGPDGLAYRVLEQLTGMLERQQEVIRQTNRLPRLLNQKTEDQKKRYDALATEEDDLSRMTKHLSAELDSRIDPSAIAGLQEPLARAGATLSDAAASLHQVDSAKANDHEHAALGNLVAARKEWYELVRRNPGAFLPKAEELAQHATHGDQDNRLPDGDELIKQFHQQQASAGAAGGQVEELLKKQQAIERTATQGNRSEYPRLANDQEALRRELTQLVKDNPTTFRGMERQAVAADQQMQLAAKSLRQNDADAPRQARDSVEELEQLAEALRQDVESAKLAEAMSLEEELERNIEQYATFVEQPNDATREQLEKATDDTDRLVDQLQELAKQQPPPSDDAGQSESALQKALIDETKQQLSRDCGKLRQQQAASERKQTAGDIKEALEGLAQALGADKVNQNVDLNSARLAENMRQIDASRQQIEEAREFVQKSLLEQRTIERGANPRSTKNFPQLAEKQEQLQKSFEEFTKKNPQSFCNNPSECNGAQAAMQEAGRSLKLGAKEARQQAGAAADQLQQLDDALERRQQQNDLTDAYRLKQMLDQQISQLKQFEQNPEAVSSAQCQQAGAQGKSTNNQLQQLAERPAIKETFGPELGGTLSDQSKQQLDSQSDSLGQSKTPQETQAASQQLRQGLEQVAAAFQAGKPGQQRGNQTGDSLRSEGQQAIAKGLRQLESAARRRGRTPAAGQQAASRLQQSAMENLSQGVTGQYGYNERTRQFLLEMKERMAEPDFRINGQELTSLIQEIQRLRREVAVDNAPSTRDIELIDVDPSEFPADYRNSIQNYFESLSKQR